MVTIQILKNGQPIMQRFCTEKMKQRTWDHMVDLAGGMYNGVDKISVIIL